MTPKEYQKLIAEKLRTIYPGIDVQEEWRAMRGEASLYCPRLDIAVGPFAYNDLVYSDKYNELMNHSQDLIEIMLNYHKHNVKTLSRQNCDTSLDDLYHTNSNARCLFAIEVENRVSRKHLIGGAVNAAALGRIGIVVAWTHEKLMAFVRLRRYLKFLGKVGKNTFNTSNLLILDRDQLSDSLEQVIHTH